MHINEDRLLEYGLKIVDDDDESMEIERHLEACQSCRSSLKRVLSDIDVISSIHPERPVTETATSTRIRKALLPLLRTAAVIVISLATGFGASAWLADKPARVVPQYVSLSSPVDTIGRYPVADATGISPEY